MSWVSAGPSPLRSPEFHTTQDNSDIIPRLAGWRKGPGLALLPLTITGEI